MAEIERKFVLKERPEVIKGLEGVVINQGYLPSKDGEFRLRQKGSRYFLTAKGDGGLSREEWETEIPEWAFNIGWVGTDGYRVEKTRYSLEYNGHILEIDIFQGSLEGHYLMECEFQTEEEAADFALPDWATDAIEVTSDKKYKNLSLALWGWPEN